MNFFLIKHEMKINPNKPTRSYYHEWRRSELRFLFRHDYTVYTATLCCRSFIDMNNAITTFKHTIKATCLVQKA